MGNDPVEAAQRPWSAYFRLSPAGDRPFPHLTIWQTPCLFPPRRLFEAVCRKSTIASSNSLAPSAAIDNMDANPNHHDIAYSAFAQVGKYYSVPRQPLPC